MLGHLVPWLPGATAPPLSSFFLPCVVCRGADRLVRDLLSATLAIMKYLIGAASCGTFLCFASACADTYCQGGPRYGTQCYSGATVRPHDPGAPVAPLPPASLEWWKRPASANATVPMPASTPTSRSGMVPPQGSTETHSSSATDSGDRCVIDVYPPDYPATCERYADGACCSEQTICAGGTRCRELFECVNRCSAPRQESCLLQCRDGATPQALEDFSNLLRCLEKRPDDARGLCSYPRR